MTTFPHHNLVGWTVGAERWPFHGSHPEGWLAPWRGEVMALNDIRAWEGRGAFPAGTPDQAAVDEHVRYCLDCFGRNLLGGRVPVLWTHGHFEPVIHWESLDRLKDYAADLAEWRFQHEAALDAERRRRADRAA